MYLELLDKKQNKTKRKRPKKHDHVKKSTKKKD